MYNITYHYMLITLYILQRFASFKSCTDVQKGMFIHISTAEMSYFKAKSLFA